MLWGSSILSEFYTSLSKVLTLWHCVKVKQRYHTYYFYSTRSFEGHLSTELEKILHYRNTYKTIGALLTENESIIFFDIDSTYHQDLTISRRAHPGWEFKSSFITQFHQIVVEGP